MEEAVERLKYLSEDTVWSVLSDTCTDSQIYDLCSDIATICTSDLHYLDVSNRDQLLKVILPRSVELIFRRESQRRDEICITTALQKAITFLSSSNAQSVLELCELRNMLLVGGNHYGFLFLDPKQVIDPNKPISSGSISYGHSHYSNFGKPIHMLIDGRVVSFWPDEWRNYIGGNKSIGCRLYFLNDGQLEIKDKIVEGEVTEYNQATDLYIVSYYGKDQQLQTTEVNLVKIPHWWIDSTQNNVAGPSSERLNFSVLDTGKFVRIWWSRYNRFYYGRVVAFDAAKQTHTVIYEDKDTRVYDMRSKDYEIVNVPADVKKQVSGVHDAVAAQIAADWHRTKGITALNSSSKDGSNSDSDQSRESSSCFISRPVPSQAFNLSMHQLNFLNSYFANNGFENMLVSLSNTSSIPPNLRVVVSQLQFLYQLKQYINPKKFRGLAWDIKEAVAMAISRYNEIQLRDFSMRDFYDMHNILKDIVTIVSNDASDNVSNDLLESLDYLRLTLAIKLFATVQVQKRSMGLSMLKDFVDFLYPKVGVFLAKRYAIINSKSLSNGISTISTRSSSKTSIRSFISPQSFDKWFSKSFFMDLLLGDNFHQDLVSKSDTIFVYMASKRILTEQHITQLWQCTKGAHEAVSRVVHNVLLLILPVLEPTLRNNFLFSLISSVPRRDYSVQFVEFVAQFTVFAIRILREEDRNLISHDSISPSNEDTQNRRDDRDKSKTLRTKAQIVNTPQKQYFGFSLLWQFVLNRDEMDQFNTNNSNSIHSGTSGVTNSVFSEDVVEAAITCIVDLLREEFSDDRESAMQTCIDNVELGLGVATSLALLRRILLLYPQPTKSWFVLGRAPAPKHNTISQQVDRLIKQSRLLDILFLELGHYHRRVQNDKATKELDRGRDIESLHPSLAPTSGDKSKSKEVVERLEFLKFVLSKASVKLTEQQLSILWRVFGESAATGETIDCLCGWLDALVQQENRKVINVLRLLTQDIDPVTDPTVEEFVKFLDVPSATAGSIAEVSDASSLHISIVDEDILMSFFENNLLPWAFEEDKVELFSRPSVTSLFIKMFLFCNIGKKNIRLEGETNWFRIGPTIGLSVIWRISMDSFHPGAAYVCSKLLVELQHRYPFVSGATLAKAKDNLRRSFIQICFKQLYFAVQNLQQNEEQTHSSVAQPPMQNLLQMEWFESNYKCLPKEVALRRITRLIATFRLFMSRFLYSPSYFVKVKVFSKSEDTPVFSFRIASHDTVGILRVKISEFFKESVDSMVLYLRNLDDIGERLDKDNVLISSVRSGLDLSIIARKVDVAQNQPNKGNAQNIGSQSTQKMQTNQNSTNYFSDAADVITVDDMKKSLRFKLLPFSWLCPKSSGDCTNSFTLYPMRSVQEMIISRRVPEPSESIESSLEFLSVVVKSNEKYIDQLLEMLDGFLAAEVSQTPLTGNICISNVWDILQILPFQPSLVSHVTTQSAQLTHLLDIHSPNRLLYTLQIIDSFSDGSASKRSRLCSEIQWPQWAFRFLNEGGLERMVQLLRESIDLICSPESPQVDDRNQSEIDIGTARNVSNLYSASNDCISGKNLYFVISSFIVRLLHRLLQVDSAYRMWCSQSSVQTSVIDSSGVFMSLLQTEDVLRDLSSLLSVAFNKNLDGVLASHVMCTVTETVAQLGLCLCAAQDQGNETLARSGLLSLLLWRCCVLIPFKEVRYSVARSVLQVAVGVFSRCLDPSAVQQRQKLVRLAFIDQLHHAIIDGVLQRVNDFQSNFPTLLPPLLPHFDAALNLLAAIECLKVRPSSLVNEITCDTEFPISNSAVEINDWTIVSSERENKLDPETYFPAIVKYMCSYRSTESFHSGVCDETVLGFLRIVAIFAIGTESHQDQLLQLFEHNDTMDKVPFVSVVSLVLHRCLFPYQQSPASLSTTVLCQSQYSRQLAFAVLYILCASNQRQLRTLVQLILQEYNGGVEFATVQQQSEDNRIESLLKATDTKKQDEKKSLKRRRLGWDYDPAALLKSAGDSLGLKNQGGTCYMNAFLQQLYHIPAFRDGILHISQYSQQEEFEQVLFQLQVLFGYLRLSQKRYYDTLPFCQAIIDYDGSPISLTEQKDINEFAGILFDKLEKTAEANEILRQTIRGTLVWKTKSLETPYRSEREESFYMVTLEVKDKSCIEDSLELSVAEELFSGENKIQDSVAGIKVDATRRAAIRNLPPTLIIQLKRFEFDLETMNRKKLNDFMSFPMELDMFPYTEEAIFSEVEENGPLDSSNSNHFPDGDDDKREKYTPFSRPTRKPDAHYQYILTGVVAHVGAIDRGHYYSFVRQNQGQNNSGDQWLEFNDRLVLPFSPDLIPKECFGGPEEGYQGNSGQASRMRENNAYLLVYQRKEIYQNAAVLSAVNSAPSTAVSPTVSIIDLQQNILQDAITGGISPLSLRSLMSHQKSSPICISDRVLKFILAENAEFQSDRFKFDTDLFTFIWSLTNSSVFQSILSQKVEEKDANLSRDVLGGWATILLRFIIDVAIHARAKQATLLLIDRLEDVVVQNKTRDGAIAILRLLGHMPIMEMQSQSPTEEQGITNGSALLQVNPLMETLFLYCPHGNFIIGLAKVIKAACFGLSSQIERDGIAMMRANMSLSVPLSQDSSENDKQISPQQLAKQYLLQLPKATPLYWLASLSEQLLSIVEQISIDDIFYKDGFSAACDILSFIATLGENILTMLLQLRAIERVVLVVLSLNSSRQQIPLSKLTNCFGLAASLVRGCSSLHDPMSEVDKHAYLNKVFLNDAITVGATDASTALQSLCKSSQLKDNLRLLDFIAEKILDCASSVNGTSLLYRPFFRVFSDLILDTLLTDIENYIQVLRKLVSSAYTLASRQQANDAEFVYATSKLLHRIGTTGPLGYAVVMQLYDYWREISARFAHSAPKKQSLAVFSIPQVSGSSQK